MPFAPLRSIKELAAALQKADALGDIIPEDDPQLTQAQTFLRHLKAREVIKKAAKTVDKELLLAAVRYATDSGIEEDELEPLKFRLRQLEERGGELRALDALTKAMESKDAATGEPIVHELTAAIFFAKREGLDDNDELLLRAHVSRRS